jgi:hypothetical protein
MLVKAVGARVSAVSDAVWVSSKMVKSFLSIVGWNTLSHQAMLLVTGKTGSTLEARI